MMGVANTSETSANFYQTTWRNNPEDSHLQSELSSMWKPLIVRQPAARRLQVCNLAALLNLPWTNCHVQTKRKPEHFNILLFGAPTCRYCLWRCCCSNEWSWGTQAESSHLGQWSGLFRYAFTSDTEMLITWFRSSVRAARWWLRMTRFSLQCALLSCAAMLSYKWIPAFRRNTSPPSSGLAVVTTEKTTLRHNPNKPQIIKWPTRRVEA
jgi:hypothetical protein